MMKRSALRRTTPLKRSPLRARRKPRPVEPGQLDYKLVRHGICRVCGATGLVRRHHVLYEQEVRREGGDPYDLRNSLWVGVEGMTCDCHERHHNASRRIPLEVIPPAALSFAVELLGEARAADYVARRYGAGVTLRRAA